MIKFNGIEIAQGHFPDNTLMMKIEKEVYDSLDSNQISLVEWFYESDAELFTIICLRKHFSGMDMALYMPYCPHARMDRVKNPEDVFTLKFFAETLNSLNFNLVFCDDVHSNVAAALINNFYHIDPAYNNAKTAYEFVKSSSDDEVIACFPDEGAMKRYSDSLGIPYAFGIKKRDWQTGKIMGLELMNKELVAGKDVLIVDDICSRGGTFYHTAKALKEAGAKKVYLYVTHCEGTVLKGDLPDSGLIEHIFTTKSIFPRDVEIDFVSFIENI
jgi:ribose-phosphate pyrophosphokinase